MNRTFNSCTKSKVYECFKLYIILWRTRWSIWHLLAWDKYISCSLLVLKIFNYQKQPFRGVLKICSKFTGEHPSRSVISIKLLCSFIEITLWHVCSPVNLLHIFWTLFYKKTSGGLLLNYIKTDIFFRIFRPGRRKESFLKTNIFYFY